MRRAILAGAASVVLSASLTYAAVPHAAPPGVPGACLTAPSGEFHRPMGAGSLAWRDTLAFLPRCAVQS